MMKEYKLENMPGFDPDKSEDDIVAVEDGHIYYSWPEAYENLQIKLSELVMINRDLEEENEELRNDLKFLRALESAGVDNWDGYQHAQNMVYN